MKAHFAWFVCFIILICASPVYALDVVGTLPDLSAIAQAVGGAEVSVTTLARANEDPHFVDPRPDKIIALNRADVLVMVGLELEDAWLVPLVKQARNTKIEVGGEGRVIASNGVKLLEKPKGKIERSSGDIHPGGNPHFTFDPRSAARIAVQLQKKFSALDPENDAYYKSNTKTFLKELKGFMKETVAKFGKLSSEQRQVVTYHKSLIYLLNWLGIREIINLEPKPGIPPNPSHLATVLKRMKGTKTHVILQESFYPRKASENLASLSKGTLVVVPGATNFTPPTAKQTYIEHMKEIVEPLYIALSVPPSLK